MLFPNPVPIEDLLDTMIQMSRLQGFLIAEIEAGGPDSATRELSGPKPETATNTSGNEHMSTPDVVQPVLPMISDKGISPAEFIQMNGYVASLYDAIWDWERNAGWDTGSHDDLDLAGRDSYEGLEGCWSSEAEMVVSAPACYTTDDTATWLDQCRHGFFLPIPGYSTTADASTASGTSAKTFSSTARMNSTAAERADLLALAQEPTTLNADESNRRFQRNRCKSGMNSVSRTTRVGGYAAWIDRRSSRQPTILDSNGSDGRCQLESCCQVSRTTRAGGYTAWTDRRSSALLNGSDLHQEDANDPSQAPCETLKEDVLDPTLPRLWDWSCHFFAAPSLPWHETVFSLAVAGQMEVC